MTGGGALIDSQANVGGYPEVEPTSRMLDVPSAGVEAWLEGMAAELE